MKRILSFSLLAALIILPAAVFAHGVEIFDVTGQAGVRTLRFMYSTGESMLFAVVKVYPPSTPEATVQESMTDRDGYFSFVPFEKGPWRLTVEDGMGHKGTITITVEPGAADGTVPGAGGMDAGTKAPLVFRLILGLSLILNIFAFYNFVLPRIKGSGKKKENARAY